MNKLLAGAATGIVGAGVFIFGGNKLIDAATIPEEQQRADIEACAAQLGSVAVQTEHLPDGCSEDLFTYTYTVKRTPNPHSDVPEYSESPKVYELPSAQQYRDELINNIATNEDTEYRLSKVMTIVFAVLGGGAGFNIGYTASKIRNKRRASSSEQTDV